VHKLEPAFHERIWGATKLDPWFPDAGSAGPIGEVWFETPEIPLLVKFLFTSDKLSVQVHPGDEYAGFHHGSPGKTEMWRVLAAEPGAQIAAGFRDTIGLAQASAAALSGDIVDLLEWHPAAAGDTFFIPAGTVHAIGAGLTICEIQQRSDITYRLFDFRRGRELHLNSALAVSHLGPYAPRREAAVSCAHFVTEPLDVAGATTLPPATRKTLLVVIGGEGLLNGQPARAGDVWHLPISSEPLKISGGIRLLRTYVPSQAP